MLTLLLWTAACYACMAQTQPLQFEQIGIADGLSQNTVRCIFQDRKGFLWFGTKDGLNKYDSYRFYTFKRSPRNENSLASNDIKCIIDDAAGRLWIATWDGGLNCYDPATGRFTRYLKKEHGNSIASNFLEALGSDTQGRIWIGTADSGLDCFDTRTGLFHNYHYDSKDPGSLSDNRVTAIYTDRQGQLWVGTASGLNRFDARTGRFTRMQRGTSPHALTNDHVKFVYEDRKGQMWIGSYDGGLHQFDRRTGYFTAYNTTNSQLSSDALLGVAEDAQGRLWIGTENGGLNIFDPATGHFSTVKARYNDPTAISSNTINAVYNDNKGNMWMGTLNGGITLARADQQHFLHYKYVPGQNSLANNTVACIYEDSHHQYWIGTDGGGLDCFDPQTGHFTHFGYQPGRAGICSDYILSVCEDADGNLWAGSWGNGITVYNPRSKTFTQFKHKPGDTMSLGSNYAFHLFRDRHQQIWIGTYGGGLDRYDASTKTFRHYVHRDGDPASLSTDNILTLNEDNQGRLLVGTDGAGLSILDPLSGAFTHFTTSGTHRLSNNSISDIYPDPQGNLWLTTNDGLDRIDGRTGEVHSYFKEDGLPSNMVVSVLPDHDHHLWIATDHGLSRMDLRQNTFRNFTQADGLQSNEFKYSRCLGSNGQLYFGGINGFTAFDPATIHDFNYDPPIVFTDFQVFNKHLPSLANITYNPDLELSYKQSVLTFEFASLNYVGRDEKQYAYTLDGFDTQWHTLGTRNNITYTNLDPGTYTLKVKGYTNNGVFSNKMAEVHIVIKPPYWRTWWFRTGMLLLLAGVVVALFYLRVHRIKRHNRQLETEVSKRTQELKEANAVLQQSYAQIKVQNGQLEAYNKVVTDKSEEIIQQQAHILLQNAQLENTIEQLEKSNATKNRFLSILAHDLRNPIAAIAGIARNLKAQLPQMQKNEIGTYISTIGDSSKSVLDLLLNLLDWARTQQETLRCHPQDVSLAATIGSIQLLLEQLLRDKNIYFTVQVAPEHVVWADPQMLETVLRNLLSNAIKFTPPYGHIHITASQAGGEIQITVRDTGMGMSAAQLENLFTPEASSAAGSNGERGTGLGLIIVKEFVEANGGTVSVSSLMNEGTTFQLRLPRGAYRPGVTNGNGYTIAYESLQKEKLLDQKQERLRGKKLLYIDDNADMRAYLHLMLSPVFEVMAAPNGQEGIQAAIEFQPDVIITDMLMPVMDGLELARRLKQNPLVSHIPIVLLTSQTDTAHQLMGYEAGVDAYLTKPVVQKLLIQVLYNLVTSRADLRNRFVNSEELYPDNATYNARDKDFMDQLITYIEAHINQHSLDHKQLCELLAMSRTILYAKVKTLTGLGVHEFIQSVRVKKGLQLLLEGKLNINQVSYEVGFNTPSYFSKCFVKQFGMAPKEYVARMQKA